MNRTFTHSFVSAGVGFGAGAAYVLALARSGTCPDVLGRASRTTCSTQEVVSGGLAVFALVTVTLTLLVAVLTLRRGEVADRTSFGDTFVAMGSIVAMVEATVLTVSGSPMGIAHGVAVFGLTLFGVRQASSFERRDREVAAVVAMALTLAAVVWVALEPAALLLAMPVAVLWVLGALAYSDGARETDAGAGRMAAARTAVASR